MNRPTYNEMLKNASGFHVRFFDVLYNTPSLKPSWLEQSDYFYLDINLEHRYCGNRKISNLVNYYYERDDGHVVMTDVVSTIYLIYKDKWNRLYSAMVDSDYNPLENYDMEEVETPDITKERTRNEQTKLTTTKGGTSSTTGTSSSSGSSDNNVFGFNSATHVPSSDASASSSGNTSMATTDSETETIEGKKNENGTEETETESGTRSLTRHGNIGVTTSQQMLQSEIDLRNKNNFYEIVLNDVAKLLCLSVY